MEFRVLTYLPNEKIYENKLETKKKFGTSLLLSFISTTPQYKKKKNIFLILGWNASLFPATPVCTYVH